MSLFFFIQKVWAACDPTNPSDPSCPAPLTNLPGQNAPYTLETVFINVVNVVAAATALAFFVMIVVSGLKLVFAQGDAKRVGNASSTITWAFVGVIFVVLAWLILNLIATFTGNRCLTIFRVGVAECTISSGPK